MSLADLTDRTAVLKSIEECDRLGRDAFLLKYGFGTATGYWLVHRGRSYDSKAIAGAAHGFQYPDRGPMRAGEFSGGENTVQRRLEKLGFTVVRKTHRPRCYWVLCANPKRYRIEDAVRELETDYWMTGGSKLMVGDHVVIWKSQGRDNRRGLVAFGEVLSPPEMISTEDNPYWVDRSDGVAARERVCIRYIHAPKLPLWTDDHACLKELSVYRSKGGTVFRLTDAQWREVVRESGADLEPWALPLETGPAGDYSLDRFTPMPSMPVLRKQVGSSQHTDGVRIDEEFHSAFNPPDSPLYTPRGQARDVLVLFNNKVFDAEYRYEGQSDESRHLESIRFRKELKQEFLRVFPSKEGVFTIAAGQDLNHFVFSHSAAATEIEEDDADGYPEGRPSYRQHRRLERNPMVVRKAKSRFASRHGGRLFCEACLVDFEATYGTRGRGFIEGHHKRPVAEMQEGDETRVEDIAMLCPNCHRMIHRSPSVTVEALASTVAASRTR